MLIEHWARSTSFPSTPQKFELADTYFALSNIAPFSDLASIYLAKDSSVWLFILVYLKIVPWR